MLEGEADEVLEVVEVLVELDAVDSEGVELITETVLVAIGV